MQIKVISVHNNLVIMYEIHREMWDEYHLVIRILIEYFSRHRIEIYCCLRTVWSTVRKKECICILFYIYFMYLILFRSTWNKMPMAVSKLFIHLFWMLHDQFILYGCKLDEKDVQKSLAHLLSGSRYNIISMLSIINGELK